MILLLIGLFSIIVFALFTIGLKYVSPDKSIFFFEVGYFYPVTILISIILSVIPLWITETLEIPPLDNRFIDNYFEYKDAESVGYMYLLYLISFCSGYVYFRRGLNSNRDTTFSKIYTSQKGLFFIIAIYILLELYLIILRTLYNIESDSYVDSYIMYKKLPLILQQITGVIIGTINIIKILMLVVFFQNYSKNRIVILTFIGYNFVQTLIVLGERTNLITLIICYLILYHTIVKAIPFKKMVLIGTLGIIFILFLGQLRSSKGDVSAVIGSTSNQTISGGEFESIFLNSVDVFQRKKTDKINIPVSLYFSSLVSIVPQQFLPFEKTTYSDWYIGTFYPSDQENGNGYAFGTVAESIVGFGVLQLIFHAFLLAYLFSKLHKKYLNNDISVQFYCFYIWLTLFCYYCFRLNTFSLVPLIVYRFIPISVLFGLINGNSNKK